MKRIHVYLMTVICMSFAQLLQASTPGISRIYGDYFVPEVIQYQLQGPIGTLDTTFQASGSESLSAQFVSSQAKAMQILSDGSVLVVLDDGTNSKVVKYTATGALYTTTGGTFGTSSACALTGLTAVTGMMIDCYGRILVFGNNNGSSHAWLRRITSAGIVDTTFTSFVDANWTSIGAISEQQSEDIIIVGLHGSTPSVARIFPAGGIDTTFGVTPGSGYTTFNGNTADQYDVVVTSLNTIFISYIDATSGYASLAKYSAAGTLETAYNSTGIITQSLGTVSPALGQLRLALDASGNVVIAGYNQSNAIYVASYPQADSGTIIPVLSPFSVAISGDALQLSAIITTSDGNILLLGGDITSKLMTVFSITSAGSLDAQFNGNGILQFSISSPDTSSILLAGAIAPNGELYAVGYQLNSGTTTPYLSAMYNEIYVTQVAQYPTTTQQGNIDLSFGSGQTIGGIVRSFNGIYGSNLDQTANCIIELASGQLLVGVSGFLNTSASSNMMLSLLNADGTLNANYSLTQHAPNEYLTTVIQNADTTLLVAGYTSATPGGAATGVIVREYNSTGVEQWQAPLAGTGYKSLGMLTQGSGRILVFMQTSATAGAIAAFNPVAGVLDVTFNPQGVVPGMVTPADFLGTPLATMGPVYGFSLDIYNNICIAYKNSSTGYVDVAKINIDGTGLITAFGYSGATPTGTGISPNVFGVTIANAQDVSMVTTIDNALQINIAYNGGYLLAQLYIATGSINTSYAPSGYFTIADIGTTTAITNIIALSDLECYLFGKSTTLFVDSMIVIKVVYSVDQPLAILDTTFNAQGSTPGILSLQVDNIAPSYTTRFITGAAIQAASGNIVVSAYEQSSLSESIPMAMHLYGMYGETEVNQNSTSTATVAGAIDTTFGNSGGAQNLTATIAPGQASVIYSYVPGNPNQQFTVTGVDTGTSTVIARINQNSLLLDSSFGPGGAGTVTLAGSVSGVNFMTGDNQNNLLIGGSTDGTTAWMQLVNNTGTTDTSFTLPLAFKSVASIGQQQSGRYIAVGIDASNKGAIVAFQDIPSDNTYYLDTTFNPLGAVPGVYEIPTSTGLYDLSITPYDTIFTSYLDAVSGHVTIAYVKANGSGPVTSFHGGLPVDTGIVPTDASSIHCAIDTNNNVIVAAPVGGNSVSVIRYTTAGVIDPTFNPILGVGTIQNITGLGSAGVVIASLIIDQDDNIIIIGNNTAGANGLLYATRLTSGGVLDPTWNATPTPPDVPGILTYTVAGSTNANDATIFIDGQILVAGAAVPRSTTAPLMVAILGNNYTTAFAQQPDQAPAGTIDETLDTITPGSTALNLQSYLPSLSLASSTAQKIFIYPSGAMLLAFNQGTSTILASLDAAQNLNTAGFNSGAVGSPAGSVTILNADTITDLFVNNGTNGDNNIYMTGLNSGTLWTAQVSATGTVNSFTTTDTLSMSVVTRIRRSTNNRTLISGYAAGSIGRGIIAAYSSDESELDLSFGGGLGYYTAGMSRPIGDMQLDQYDRMYIAYARGSKIIIDRVESDGTTTQAWSNFGTNISVVTAPQIRLAIDQANNQLVVAVQNGTFASNIIAVRRYNLTTGADTCDSEIDIVATGDILILAELFIDDEQNIYVAGYDATINNIVVEKINSIDSTHIALDPTYGEGQTGIADVSAQPNMTIVTSAALDPDRRVYLVGAQATPTPAMARLFGYAYVTELSDANTAGLPGVIDLTIDGGAVTPDGGIDLSTLPNWSGLSGSGYTAQTIYTNADGSAYILFGNGTYGMVGQLTGDMNPNLGFGNNGLTTPVSLESANNLGVDSQGRILVTGITPGGIQAVFRYSPAGVLLTTFTSAINLSSVTRVEEQRSGRVLISGYNGTSGVILAYQHTGAALDATYGPVGSNGFYATGVAAQIDDFVLDNYDDAYVVYRDGSNHLSLQKITANGSGLVPAFASESIIDTGIVATSQAHIAINNDGNIIVGASTSSGVQTALYNGTTGVIIGSVQTITSANSPILTSFTAAGNNFLGSVYTTQPMMVSFRILGSNGLLDTIANGGVGFGPTLTGISSYDPESATQMNNVGVQFDGRIVMVGKNSSAPVIMRVYGTPYVAQDAQYPDASPVGTLDPTLNPPTGALNFDTLLSTGSLDLAGFMVKRVFEHGNGVMLFVCDDGTDTILFRLNKDLTLDATFGSGSPRGYITLAGLYNATGLSVDPNGSIFVAGGGVSVSGVATSGWFAVYDNSGTAIIAPITTNLTAGAYQIGVQSLGRTIVAGQISNGTLLGYTNAGVVDVTFGTTNTGITSTGITEPISGLTVDEFDRLIIVYNLSGSVALQQVSADGSTIVPLNAGTAITGVIGNQIKVIQDGYGNNIVAATTLAGFSLQSYNNVNGANNGSLVTIAIDYATLGNIYITNNNQVVLVGYTATGSIVVARFTIASSSSGLAIDTTFNAAGSPAGVLVTTVGLMNIVCDAVIHADDRIMIVGGSSTSHDPYMARVFGDNYVTVIDQSQIIEPAGVNDLTFGLTHTNGVVFFPSPSITIGVAQAIALQGYDQIVIALEGQHTIYTQSQIFVNAFTTGGLPDTTFNGTGQAAVPHYYNNEYVRDMVVFSQNSVHKAILAGYATNTALGTTDSVIWQYNMTTAGLDSSFGGFDGSPAGIAFGDGQQINVVGQQSTGRIIAGGLDQLGNGLLLGYTTIGKLDTSFGTSGYQSVGTGSTGIYTHAIDTENRIIIAYNNAGVVEVVRFTVDGSAPDNTFTPSAYISTVTSNSNMKIAIDTSNNVYVAAVTGGGNTISVIAYNASNGTQIGTTAVIPYSLIGGSSSSTYILGRLLLDIEGNVLIIGYDTYPTPNTILITRLNSGLVIDDTFNPYNATINPTGTNGYLLYAISTGNTQVAVDALIHPDGRIIVVGDEA